jgi:hypothetical protein
VRDWLMFVSPSWFPFQQDAENRQLPTRFAVCQLTTSNLQLSKSNAWELGVGDWELSIY